MAGLFGHGLTSTAACGIRSQWPAHPVRAITDASHPPRPLRRKVHRSPWRIVTLLGLAYGLLVLGIAIPAALFSGTIFALPFAWMRRGERERHTVRAAVVWSRGLLNWLLFVRTTVTGETSLGDEEGALVVSNHRSWVDPLLMIAELRAMGLSKAEIFWLPMIGQYAWLSGAVFVNRKSPENRKFARDEVMKLIRGGARVALFPEGTRSRDGKIRDKVYLSLPMDCWHENIPVQPCAVYGTERVLPPTRPVAIPFQTCRIDIGEVLRPADYPDAKSFAQAVWADVIERVERMQAEDS